MQLNSLKPADGSKKARRRVGRGIGSGLGKTAGRGHKGQKSRAGGYHKVGFEGGQMPLQRRLPKRGFKAPFRVPNTPVNIGELAKFAPGSKVGVEELIARGLIPRKACRVKILGEGELPHALTVVAHAFSASAEQKIKAVGGTVELIPVREPYRRETKGAAKRGGGEG